MARGLAAQLDAAVAQHRQAGGFERAHQRLAVAEVVVVSHAREGAVARAQAAERAGHDVDERRAAGDEIAGHRHQVGIEPVRRGHPAGDAPAARERTAVQVGDLDDPVAVERFGQAVDLDVATPDARPLVKRQGRAGGGRDQRGDQRCVGGCAQQETQRERERRREAEQQRDRPPDEERPQHQIQAHRPRRRPGRSPADHAADERRGQQGRQRDHGSEMTAEVRQRRDQRNLQADREQHDHHQEASRTTGPARAGAIVRGHHAQM